jgi:CBS domain-containing protein
MTRSLSRNMPTKGVMHEGPKNQRSKINQKSGDIMKVASKRVISTHASNTIKNAAKLMRDSDVRRLPVVHGGTGALEGLLAAMDVLDFLGGGPKYKIIEQDYKGNFLAAVNCPVSKIMRPSQYLTQMASVEEAVDIMLNKKSSCIPVIGDEKRMDIVALVSEHDLMPLEDPSGMGATVREVMHKNPIIATLGMMISDVSKIMVRNQFRRLPVIREDRLVGVVTALDVVGYLEDGHYKGVSAEENLSTRVDEILTEKVVTVDSSADVGQVVKLVKETGYGGFPVVDSEKLQGIITTTDILRWVYRQD